MRRIITAAGALLGTLAVLGVFWSSAQADGGSVAAPPAAMSGAATAGAELPATVAESHKTPKVASASLERFKVAVARTRAGSIKRLSSHQRRAFKALRKQSRNPSRSKTAHAADYYIQYVGTDWWTPENVFYYGADWHEWWSASYGYYYVGYEWSFGPNNFIWDGVCNYIVQGHAYGSFGC